MRTAVMLTQASVIWAVAVVTSQRRPTYPRLHLNRSSTLQNNAKGWSSSAQPIHLNCSIEKNVRPKLQQFESLLSVALNLTLERIYALKWCQNSLRQLWRLLFVFVSPFVGIVCGIAVFEQRYPRRAVIIEVTKFTLLQIVVKRYQGIASNELKAKNDFLTQSWHNFAPVSADGRFFHVVDWPLDHHADYAFCFLNLI